ncbi:ADI_G0024890.mRNA.1.CDS.1 [Saccharomyces cerevisiae]|uniref:Probable transport protein YPL264C n=3 Tax=Saccharomyces cerevisiae TaxID=4932 RepID=YP264_YEAST|nr:uncharacterized protein YPL264C [Saccharomyces cerevisiae S288C]Q08980.1 RecName: Full=Probable transport protein YPL264C [Saccharomyces cerevisiae S288C]AAT92611.1 YPL264C [Saccharomyces cerevisiae]AHY77922.1 hypothetical protein H779_YJM993P00017 [Saccharomyces cerevisiae YJM993]AJP41890.1 hypothetical protein F842_YJM1078P00017 [Saccharomyces cerevisiae YJM1078]AJU23334.1 hypothetical protein H830_YJM1526H00413 [Saccharomyces cerevisiae YJM1526]AJU31872.1 hypothetical protein H771_YJM96|eukprot:NP_015059.1 hypothetical protein YPL264C [Saccharomyces cerevisiae S288C]
MTLQRISKDYLKPNYGLILLIVSYFFNSSMVVSTKVLENDPLETSQSRINPLQILLVRMSITYCCTLVYMHWNKQSVPDIPWGPAPCRKWLILRGIMGFFGVFGMYFSLMYLSISDAVLITFMSPTLTIFLSFLLLGEPFSKLEALGSLISFSGVVLIIRPTFLFGEQTQGQQSPQDDIVETQNPKLRLIAIGVSLLGVCGLSSVYIIIRYIGNKAHAIMSVSYFSLVTTVVAALGVLLIPSMSLQLPHSWKQWGLFLNLGISGFIHQILLTMGIQRERAGRGSLMTYTQVIYAVFWDVVLFHHWPNIWTWCGMAVIVSSTIWVINMRASKQNVVATAELLSTSDFELDDLED